MPDYVRSVMFEPALRSWARAEAMAEAAFDWATSKDDPDEMFELKPGVMRSPAEIWRALDGHAARMRARMGMDPLAYSQLARDLGLTERVVQANLEKLASEGAAIIERRLGPAAIAVTAGGDSGGSRGGAVPGAGEADG